MKTLEDFAQQGLDSRLRNDLEQLVHLAIREDLDRGFDLTTMAVVPTGLPAVSRIRAREPGVACGIDLLGWIIESIAVDIEVAKEITDGEVFSAESTLAVLEGTARDLLTCERTILNILGRLCGIASWTRIHVDLISDLKAQLYDTRKTTPGWRRLEKYAVVCGGARNHRQGLFDAILIKDNHLACHAHRSGVLLKPSDAVRLARQFAKQQDASLNPVIEIEVDSLEQMEDALLAEPDIILLDNMQPETLADAVRIRDNSGRAVSLEASGGINRSTLRSVAESGVDRISMGGLTHSATNLDLGLDWEFPGDVS